jgi:DNA (cytosine-5)-methyltransferase 1
VVLRQHMEAHSLDEPLPTICAGGTHLGLAQPFLLNRHGDNGATRAHDLDEPMPTADCRGAGYVVEPFMMSGQSGGAPREVDQPMPGMTGRLGCALIAPYYGSGSGETCSGTDVPLPTVTTKARFGLVMPVTHGSDPSRCRSLDDPLPTITTAHRGELACIVAAFGERRGQEPRVHSVDEPTPTICATGRIQLAVAEPVVSGQAVDIRFRMLEPSELARAMGFSDEDATYWFAGNKTEVTKQIGNAVPVNLATALVDALMRN